MPAAHAAPAPVRSASVGLPDISPVGVAAVRTAAGSVVAFVRGTDGAVWDTTAVGGVFGAFQRIPSAIIGGPAAVSPNGRRIDLFAVGTDRALWHTSTTVDEAGRPTAFAPWQSLGGVLTTSPAAASTESGSLLVAGRGADGGVWFRTFEGIEGSPWEPAGGVAISAPAVSQSAGGYCLAVVGTDHGLWSRCVSAAGAPYFDWYPGNVVSTTAPAFSDTASWTYMLPVEAVGSGPGIRLYWGLERVTDIGGIVTSAPALVEWGTAAAQTWTFARGADRALWVNMLSGPGPTGTWYRIGGILA